MKIRIMSDLHLEFSELAVTNTTSADVLVLSGDIMVAEDLHDHPSPDPYSPGAMSKYSHRLHSAIRYRKFFDQVTSEFPLVIYVAGNHEFYNGKWEKTLDYLREFANEYPNLVFLERGRFDLTDVTFIGGTLWTDMNRGDPLTLHTVREVMNDFRSIRNDAKGYTKLKPADTVYRHRETLAYFKSVVEEDPARKYVVVGHHSPSFLSCHDDYKSDRQLNGAYHSDLSEFILDHPQVRLWTHGHTHHAYDYVLGETRIVCNPRGYETSSSKEHTGWDPLLTVEV